MKNFVAGQYIDQGYYKSFHPNLINRVWDVTDWSIISLLSKADRMIGRLDMYSEHIPNIDLFIRMHVVKEATSSSKIEGTQTNMEEAVLDKEDVPLDKRDDWAEIQNYIEAMSSAISHLNELPICSRLIRNVHKVLMNGVRGEHKQPGEFRSSQNWIGGSNINDAAFVPPVYTEIPALMSDIEMLINAPACELPELLKIALIHYQFETIHPFNDGNGRTGRLLITLYLVSVGLLKKPILYLSDYLEHTRNTYYTTLMRVRTENAIEDWFRYFLNGIISTAEKSVTTFSRILDLEKDYELRLQDMGSRSTKAMKLLNELYTSPITDAVKIAAVTGQTVASSYSLISDLEKRHILEEITGGKRGKKYVLREYFDLF